jgi:aspartyl-tRNA(Asn)/glutamyl-tRNA(Gln) amidotransferase subunit A
MCLGALATQTGGSITRPASYCGVYSLKPSHGRVSVDGVLPLAPSMDHVGAMANCVRDLAIVLQTIAGRDSRKGFTFHGHAPIPDVLGAMAGATSESRSDLCVLGGLFDDLLEPEISPTYQSLVDKLRAECSFVDQVVPPAGFAEVLNAHGVVMAVEAAAYHGDRLRKRPDDYPPKIRSLIEEGLRHPAVALRTALDFRADLEDQMTGMLNGRVFMTPATTSPPPTAETTGNPAFNSPWSFTGHPTVSLPYAWTADGLPLAVQLVAPTMCEDDLFAVAGWLEDRIGFERRPLPL